MNEKKWAMRDEKEVGVEGWMELVNDS